MNKEISVFAQTTYRNEFKKFGIKTDDRRRHMYLVGKTGMGKSTVLENMIIDDIRAGHGVAVVDPHGDLAEKIIEFIPSERIKDVVYFNPSDINFPIAFNVVEQVEPHLRHLVASGLIGVFQKLWADSWGPRLEYILRNAILAILDFPGSTLMGVVRMLSDKSYRKQVVANIKDPVVKAFWEKEFSGYADKFASEAVSPIQNKVGQFLSNSLMRNVIGQVKSSIDIRDIMDNGKILIMNLSKGRIGEDNSALLGAMMITKIQLAAMSRVDVPEKERRDFYLYIDEFQNFSTDSFASILSEARKYRLNLILAHQYIEQLSEKVKPAVFGNVGTMVVFRVGAADAEELVKEFTPTFTEEDLVNLPKYEMYLKLMIDGISSSPFSASGLPPMRDDEKTNNVENVIEYSRKNYASDRAVVEEKIMRWHENYGAPDASETKESKPNYTQTKPAVVARPVVSAPSAREIVPEISVSTQNNLNQAPVPSFSNITNVSNANNQAGILNRPVVIIRPAVSAKNVSINNENANRVQTATPLKAKVEPIAKPGYEAICSLCGSPTITVFIPDGIRPIYCKNCLSKRKEEKRLELENRKEAKKEEYERFIEVKEQTPATASLSLNDLNSLAPIDFKGRTLKVEKRNLISEDNGEEKDSEENNNIKTQTNYLGSEHELKEGEDIKF